MDVQKPIRSDDSCRSYPTSHWLSLATSAGSHASTACLLHCRRRGWGLPFASPAIR